jgi:hypothetical protein
MRAPWRNSVVERLVLASSPTGGFGYRPSAPPRPEPTGFGCLALRASDQHSALVEKSLKRLGQRQVETGAVLLDPRTPTATWGTAIAILAWASCDDRSYDNNVRNALTYLLRNEGKTFASNPHIYGHDTQLVGWPWIEETHTWLEPTSYALLALRATGKLDHPRAAEAIQVIYNRAIPSGGWNYGNGLMFGNALRSFPSTTGIVLAALAGRERDESASRAIDYLHAELPEVRSLFSLAWGVIGLRCWDAVPLDAAKWMERAISEDRPAPPSPLEDALMLIAAADENPFAPRLKSEQASIFETGATLG